MSNKLIDTWYFDYHGYREPWMDAERKPDEDFFFEKPPKVQEGKIKVEVRLKKVYENSRTPPQALKSTALIAECAALNISVTATDIESLRKSILARIDERFAIDWKPYLLVEVIPERPYHGEGAGFSFSYREIMKGVTQDGQLLMRIASETADHAWRVYAWPKAFKNQQGEPMACIEGNAENIAALQDFQRRILALKDRINEFLAPEAILDTLANINSNALLSPPAADEDDRMRGGSPGRRGAAP